MHQVGSLPRTLSNTAVKVRGRRKSSVEIRANDVETSVLYITVVVCFSKQLLTFIYKTQTSVTRKVNFTSSSLLWDSTQRRLVVCY